MSSIYIKISLLVFLIFIRFEAGLPVILLDDSVKYFVPLELLGNTNYLMTYIFEGLNFSLFNEVISAFFESVFSGSLSEMIFFQKILGIASTIIFYLILKNAFKLSELIATTASFLFGISPFMIYIEQTVMPESYFIFFSLIAIWFAVKFFQTEDFKAKLINLALFMSTISLTCIIKETAVYWMLSSVLALIIYFVMNYKKYSSKELAILILVLVSCSQIFLLPSKIYHFNKYGKAVDSLVSTKGVVLYTISPEMLNKPASKKYQFIQNLILQIQNQSLSKFKSTKSKLDSYDIELAYSGAISKLNVIGREGKLRNPQTGRNISSIQWADMCIAFMIEKSLQSPILFLKRVFSISFPNLFLNENLTHQFSRKSFRQGLDREVMQFIKFPHSLKTRLDPALKESKLVQAQALNQIMSMSRIDRPFVIMQDRQSSAAFVLNKKPLSIQLQEIFKDFGYAKILLPIFLVLSLLYFVNEGFKDLSISFLILSSYYFMVFPLLISMCEARYRLQFEHMMLISVVVLIQYCKNRFFAKEK
jgi:hypothetical protein